MFSFHVDPDVDILFEKLTAQIVSRTGFLVNFGTIALKCSDKQRVAFEKQSAPYAFSVMPLISLVVTSTSRNWL